MLNTWLWSALTMISVSRKIDHLRGRADRLVELLHVDERAVSVAGVVRVVDAAALDVQEVAVATARRVAASSSWIALTVMSLRLGSPPRSVGRSNSYSMWPLSKRPSTGRLLDASKPVLFQTYL